MIRPVSEVDEAITVVDYRPAWPELFATEREQVLKAAPNLIQRVEHFGSTAIPRMAGKPIVDLLAGVARSEDAPLTAEHLEKIGYENFGEIFISGRIYLRKRGKTNFNVAVTVVGSEFWEAQLLLRDYLRQHPEEAHAYSEAKRTHYKAGAQLFSSYSKAKAPFLEELKKKAQLWTRV